jgi:hypothetical protein
LVLSGRGFFSCNQVWHFRPFVMTKRKRPEDLLKRGPKSTYKSEYQETIYKLCLLNLSDAEIANTFEIPEQTLSRWKTQFPDLREAMSRGRELADANVAERLFNRAMGYEAKAVKIFMPAGAESPVYAPYIEHHPPDTQAASLWLRNRQPQKWRERTDVQLTGANSGPIMLAQVADLAASLIEDRGKTIEHEPADVDKPKR